MTRRRTSSYPFVELSFRRPARRSGPGHRRNQGRHDASVSFMYDRVVVEGGPRLVEMSDTVGEFARVSRQGDPGASLLRALVAFRRRLVYGGAGGLPVDRTLERLRGVLPTVVTIAPNRRCESQWQRGATPRTPRHCRKSLTARKASHQAILATPHSARITIPERRDLRGYQQHAAPDDRRTCRGRASRGQVVQAGGPRRPCGVPPGRSSG